MHNQVLDAKTHVYVDDSSESKKVVSSSKKNVDIDKIASNSSVIIDNNPGEPTFFEQWK